MQDFTDFIQNEKLFTPKDSILLAVSGGVDSIVMTELFHQSKFSFGIAHCNFKLRENESDEDEIFVSKLAKQYGVSFHTVSFDTTGYAHKNKISIQMAARELRYEWFEKIRREQGYTYVAVAHHHNDSIETVLINLIRGTGFAGLQGIKPKREKIVRPLLFMSREQIETFANNHKLIWREDASNQSNKYLRNRVRNEIIPQLKALNPQIEHTLEALMQQTGEYEKVLQKYIASKRDVIVEKTNNQIKINISRLHQLEPLNLTLFELLKEYGFNTSTVRDIIKSLNVQSGKIFLSPAYRLLKDRDFLILTKKESVTFDEYVISKGQQEVHVSNKWIFDLVELEKSEFHMPNTAHEAALDADLLKFPLHIRRWKEGDAFVPLGMRGHKKLSDFFIDKKLSLYEKENTFVILSGNDIVWVIGHRIDERFKITEKTRHIYYFKLRL